MTKLRIAIDTTMIDGRFAKGTAILARKEIEGLVKYKDEFEFTLVHKYKQDGVKLYENFNEIVIPRIWNGPMGGVINEFLFFVTFWIKILLGKEKKFDIYFVAYSRILPTFIFAPSKKFMFYPMDGGPATAGFVQEKVKTPFPKYVIFLKNRIDSFLSLSKFGQMGIMELLGVPESKVPVIYCAAGMEFKETLNKEKAHKDMKDKYSYPDNYILCVSRWDPHKNILGTLEAYAKYRKVIDKPLPLVFIGGKHMPEYNERVDKKIDELGIREYVKVSKFVKDEDLPYAYQAANLLVFASYYEGFGIPAIEAMACACPVICSNNSSLDEIGGPAAFKVNPYSVDEIADALVKVQTDESLRAKLIADGLAWCKQFSWEKSTREIVEVFRNVVK